MGATDVLVVLGKFSGRAVGLRSVGPVVLQDVCDLLERDQPGLVGEAAGGIETAGGITFAEVQQAQADAVRLFRMGAALELLTYQLPTSGPTSFAQRVRRVGDHCCCAR